MPKIRANKAEVRERVELVRQMLLQRRTKAEIKRLLAVNYGIKHRMVGNYIRRAQNILMGESGQDREAHVAEAYGFYLSIAKDETANHRDRLRAQERIDKLLGLESPTKYARTDSEGNDITPEQAGDIISGLVERIRQREQHASEHN